MESASHILPHMVQEGFQIYKPCKALQSYVRYYWIFKSKQPLNVPTFPIGCPQIIFHKKTPLYIPELKSYQSALSVSGQVNYPAHLSSGGNTNMITIVFQPYTLAAFLYLPISLLHNQEISGYDLENKQLNELATRIFDCEDDLLSIGIIEQWLLTTITNTPNKKVTYNLNRITAALNELLTKPGTSVNNLADIACLSKKQFERFFYATVGSLPKEYARIVRFQKSLKLLQHCSENINFAQIAYQSGYADQSHYIREFKLFSGYSPSALLNVCTPYSDLFTDPA